MKETRKLNPEWATVKGKVTKNVYFFHGLNPEIDTVPSEIRDMSQHNVCAAAFNDTDKSLCSKNNKQAKLTILCSCLQMILI